MVLVYLQNWVIYGVNVGRYSSTMVRIWVYFFVLGLSPSPMVQHGGVLRSSHAWPWPRDETQWMILGGSSCWWIWKWSVTLAIIHVYVNLYIYTYTHRTISHIGCHLNICDLSPSGASSSGASEAYLSARTAGCDNGIPRIVGVFHRTYKYMYCICIYSLYKYKYIYIYS